MRLRLRDLVLLIPFVLVPISIAMGAIVMLARGEIFVLGLFMLYLMIFGAMGIGFVNLYRRSRRRSQAEQGLEAAYTGTHGGRFDLMSYSLPFVRVSVYEGLLVIKAYDEIVFKPEDIDYLEVKFIPFTPALQIWHHKKDAPERIVIFTLDPDRLKRIIETNLNLRNIPGYGSKPEGKKIKTGKQEFWPWLKQ